jgi:hypothetical protein
MNSISGRSSTPDHLLATPHYPLNSGSFRLVDSAMFDVVEHGAAKPISAIGQVI